MKNRNPNGIPKKLQSIASERINIRLKPIEKLGIRKLASIKKETMSKSLLRILDFYYQNAIPSDFWKDINVYSSPTGKYASGKR